MRHEGQIDTVIAGGGIAGCGSGDSLCVAYHREIVHLLEPCHDNVAFLGDRIGAQGILHGELDGIGAQFGVGVRGVKLGGRVAIAELPAAAKLKAVRDQ